MYLAEVEGKGGINAKLVAYSVSPEGKKIATFELTYHRYIHGEFMTHRLFSRNAMSSRAVPVAKMLDIIRQSPAMPIHWGKNQPGMQAKEDHDAEVMVSDYDGDDWPMSKEGAWYLASNQSVRMAECFSNAGYHKQIVNRLVEPFQMMKTVMTATELDNFFWLRLDADAQPEIYELARCMRECLLKTEPELLHPGQWHTPYVKHDHIREDGILIYSVLDGDSVRFINQEEALAISSSCCAQVSYRNLDNTYEKAMAIYGRLLSGAKVHASPFEHQATPMSHTTQLSRTNFILSGPPITQDTKNWEDGVTHMDRKGKLWSGNFCGFIQHRQLLDNHNCTDYKPD